MHQSAIECIFSQKASPPRPPGPVRNRQKDGHACQALPSDDPSFNAATLGGLRHHEGDALFDEVDVLDGRVRLDQAGALCMKTSILPSWLASAIVPYRINCSIKICGMILRPSFSPCRVVVEMLCAKSTLFM